jgi:hypothetical protein
MQVALSVVLATSAGLVVRSANALEAAPRVFDSRGLFTVTIGLPADYSSPVAIAGAVTRIQSRVADLAGVTHVAVASRLPLGGDTFGSNVALAGEQLAGSDGTQARIRVSAGGYLAATGTRLIAGRDLVPSDDHLASRVVVVNRTLARALDPSGEVVGRALWFAVKPFNDGPQQRAWTIVGVADDWLDRGPRGVTQPEVFVPMAQAPPEVFVWMNRQLVVAVRSAVEASEQAQAVRGAIASVDRRIPVGRVVAHDEQVRQQFAPERAAAGLLSTAGIIGVLLATLGLFAVIKQLVVRQTRDIAVRIALGGQPASVVTAFVRDGVVLAAIGVVIGAAISRGLAGALASLLFGVQPFDIPTYASVTALVLGAAAVASWWPARRGLTLDVTAILRGE